MKEKKVSAPGSHVQRADVRVDDDIAGETDQYPKCDEDQVKLVLDRYNV